MSEIAISYEKKLKPRYYLSIHQNHWLCLSNDSDKRLTADKRYRIRVYTNPHYTVVKTSAHLKITTFSCIKLKNYIFQLFLSKILDHVTQINSEIVKSFYA